MPAGYKSTTARLQEIVAGTDWDDLSDLYTFTKFAADKMAYIVNNTSDRQIARAWGRRVALNLFLEWEPTYTTILNAMGAELMTVNGGEVSLNLANYETQLEAMHKALFPDDASKAYMMTTNGGVQFSSGNLLMSVCSRPVVLGYGNTFRGSYGDTCLETIQFPVENIAAGNSGYAISNIWDGKGMEVNGVYKSYNDLSWDFIKFIITEEGQEVAGKTGLNIPVLKSLYSDGEWRKVEALGSMDHDAWVAGGELQQTTYNIFTAKKRMVMRNTFRAFFANFQMDNYQEGSLEELITKTEQDFKNQKPDSILLGK
jgi:ABC-type glycerol-3-phosphate transport system substrate-binding protein